MRQLAITLVNITALVLCVMKKEPDPKWFVLKTAWINIWEHNTNSGHIKKLISMLPDFLFRRIPLEVKPNAFQLTTKRKTKTRIFLLTLTKRHHTYHKFKNPFGGEFIAGANGSKSVVCVMRQNTIWENSDDSKCGKTKIKGLTGHILWKLKIDFTVNSKPLLNIYNKLNTKENK